MKVLSASVGNNEARVMDVEFVLERWMMESRRIWRPVGKVVVFASASGGGKVEVASSAQRT